MSSMFTVHASGMGARWLRIRITADSASAKSHHKPNIMISVCVYLPIRDKSLFGGRAKCVIYCCARLDLNGRTPSDKQIRKWREIPACCWCLTLVARASPMTNGNSILFYGREWQSREERPPTWWIQYDGGNLPMTFSLCMRQKPAADTNWISHWISRKGEARSAIFQSASEYTPADSSHAQTPFKPVIPLLNP